MRRLLLLLLTFLLPLQLLAATVDDVSVQHVVEEASQAWSTSASAQVARPGSFMQDVAALSSAAAETPASPSPVNDDEPDAPGLQADCDDHTLPAGLATPHVCWHPFPHAFAAPLNWPSIDRAQLRPPPLA